MVNNREFAKTDDVFKTACDMADISTTVRQASKFRNRKGSAFKYRRKAIIVVNKKKEEGEQ